MIDPVNVANGVSITIQEVGGCGLFFLQLLDLVGKLADLCFQLVDRNILGILGGMTTNQARKQREYSRHGADSFPAPVRTDSAAPNIF
jgi:hypothetical protein